MAARNRLQLRLALHLIIGADAEFRLTRCVLGVELGALVQSALRPVGAGRRDAAWDQGDTLSFVTQVCRCFCCSDRAW